MSDHKEPPQPERRAEPRKWPKGEALQNIEDYANDLREVIQKMRRRLLN